MELRMLLCNLRFLYVLMALAVILASHLELRSQQAVRDMSAATLQALRLTTIAAMEYGESAFLEREASRDANTAEQYQQQAKYLDYRAKVDAVYADRNRKRGQYFQMIAVQEQKEADVAVQKVQRIEASRVELLKNLTNDEDQEAALERQERDQKVHLRFCSVFVTACAFIGGAPGLQRQELDDEHKIVLESLTLNKVEKLEFMEELVALILQGKTDQYNQTAFDLLHLADLWDARSRQDNEAAALDSETAEEIFTEETRIEARIQKEKDWMKENTLAAEELLWEAERLDQLAYMYALEAVLLAFFALLFFLPTACYRFGFLADALKQSDSRDKEETLWTVSYWMQHVFIFMLVMGMIDSDYLLHLDEYDVSKRAVILVWFAYLGACIQTILLHTIPHCMAEYPLDRYSLGDICVQFFLHTFAAMAFFIMELLIVWLTLRDILFTAETLRALSTRGFYFYFILMVTTHIAVFEPRGVSSGRNADEQSTVLMSDDDESLAESSPLREEASSYSPTEDLPLIYFRRSERPRSIDSSTRTASPYAINTDWECAKLSAAFEVLLIVCALCVLRNGLTLTGSHSSAKTLAFFGFFAALLLICLLSLVLLRRHNVPMTTTSAGEWITSSPMKNTYNSIDV